MTKTQRFFYSNDKLSIKKEFAKKMPFKQFQVEPVKISQCLIPAKEKNELEYLNNHAMASLIRQIASLGTFANQVFSNLISDAQNISSRTVKLNERIKNLREKVSKQDAEYADPPKAYFNRSDHYCSDQSKRWDQVLSRNTMPDNIKSLYEKAEPPPELNKFDSFR
jgi:hypothetical protein